MRRSARLRVLRPSASVLVLLAALLSPTAASAATITSAAVADTWVNADAPTKNYGGAARLKLDNSPLARSFVRFNVTGLTQPVASATLRLWTFHTNAAGFRVHAMTDTTWGERTTTWNNQPAYTAAATVTSGPTVANAWEELNVTPLVAGNGAVSFAITTTSNAGMQLGARSSGVTAVQLVVVEAGAADTTAPSTPSGLEATPAGQTQIDLTWTASTDDVGVAGYDVYRGGALAGTVGGGTTAFSDTGLAPSTPYTYTVVAFDAAGNHSPASDPDTATTLDPPPDTTDPTEPTDVDAVAVSPTQVEVSWTASTDDTGVAGYDVFRGATLAGTVGGTTTTFSDPGRTPNTQYTYRIEAFDAAGNRSGLSDPDSVTTPEVPANDTTPPSVPGDLSAVATGPTQVSLDWLVSTDDTGVTSYQVQRNAAIVATLGPAALAHVDGGVQQAAPYGYRVRAVDAAGNRSAWSPLAFVVTPGTHLADGFESGTMGVWTLSPGMVVQQQEVFAGAWAARATSAGTGVYAWDALSYPETELDYSARVKVVSQGGTNIGLLRFRTAWVTPILSILRSSAGKLLAYNEVSGVTKSGPTMTLGTWYEIRVRLVVNGVSSTQEVWVNGVRQEGMSVVGTANLGPAPPGRVYIGDPASGRTFDVAFDDVLVTWPNDVTPPAGPTPGSVSAAAVDGGRVNVTWAGPVGVGSYRVYRDGALLRTVGGGTTALADVEVVPGATYLYSVASVDTSGNASVPVAAAPVIVPSGGPASTTVTVAVGGDIACDPWSSGFAAGLGTVNNCRQKATSDLLWNGDFDAVLIPGDTQYDDATLPGYWQSFDASWGRMGSLLMPAPGNHEYHQAGAPGYSSYFGQASAQEAGGWYSFDIGAWHVIAMNSECLEVGGCGAGSPEEEWLRADLAAHPSQCTLAYWHEARFSSGNKGNHEEYTAWWQALHEAGAEIVLVAHDHGYERFAPQTPSGAAAPATGIRQFVVGMGGASHGALTSVQPNSEVRNYTTYGVLSLTLSPSSYSWQFLAAAGEASFADSGTTSCH